jgi:hypothetical protein
MKGYKVFNSDWTCRGFQYKVGETYRHEGKIDICEAGFHFCKKLVDCFNYYTFDPENKVAIIEATGEIIEKSDCSNNKCVTNEIKIIKELSWHEVLDMVNTGKGNTGIKNTGSYNIGNFNTGDWNTGDWNTGDWNSGHCNTGDWNSGHCNTGDCNSGDNNTGNYNKGNYNIGDCNLGNKKLGCFCTDDNDKHETIKLFNKESDWTLDTWKNSYAFEIINNCFELTLWVNECDMTGKEKEEHSEYKVTKGYLKELSYKEAWRNMWNRIDDKERLTFVSLPNFDKDIFKTITGIDIEEN